MVVAMWHMQERDEIISEKKALTARGDAFLHRAATALWSLNVLDKRAGL